MSAKAIPTWKDIVITTLSQLGGEAHLDEINAIISNHPRAKQNAHWREKVRQVVRSYRNFEPVLPQRSGRYRLVKQPQVQLLEEKLRTDPSMNHGITQGMLLTLGTMFGYETFAPKADQSTRLFQNRPLTEFASIKDLSSEISKAELERMRQVDVLWFDEDDIGIFPRYAFEVEHSTKVKSGIDRLLKIPSRYKTSLFIIAPTDDERELFCRYSTRTPYRQHTKYLQCHLYKEVEQLYNASLSFSKSLLPFKLSVKDFHGFAKS